MKKQLIALGAAVTIGVAGYFGYKSDWFQEQICENEVTTESGLATITREEYSCIVTIETSVEQGFISVSTSQLNDVYQTHEGIPLVVPGHLDAPEMTVRPLENRTLEYDIYGHEGPLIVFPAVYNGRGMSGRIMIMDIPAFCEDAR